ncbi:MAG: SIS domain-containing protein [Anaerolineae bacterium]|nr:SIS domain-containing protein [Anaerolineae bacterium]
MTELARLVEQAKQSELFTAPRLEADLATFLAERAAPIKALAAEALANGVQHVYFVGNGGSWANMVSGKYLLDRFSTLTSDVLTGYDLTWRNPPRLGPDTWVFLTSYSGNTEDTVQALRHAKSKGARTIGIIKRRDCTIAREADTAIDYDSTALYILPLATVYLFALELARLQGRDDVTPILNRLAALPPVLGRVFHDSEARAAALSQEFADSSLLYVIAAGPLYGLAYKFALTVFMENIRIHGSVIASDEFRQGPVEMLDRQGADMVFLLGTDETRDMTQRAIDVVRARENVRTIVYDMADYPDVHPLLAPFVLLVPLQWFTVYSALRAGIHDLDQRVFMGRRLLARGEATWP